MHYPPQRPRFPQGLGNMPRFPAPPMAPHGGGGMMRGPWPQRFGPPRQDMPQRFQPGGFQGQPRHMGPHQNIGSVMQKPNCPPMNPHIPQPRPNLNRALGPRGPFQTGPGFRPCLDGPPPRAPNLQQFPGPNHFQQRPNFNNRQPQAKGNKKPKVDKRDLPENNKYYCETCDRGYKDEDKYQAHLDTHEQCPEPGCTYIAAKKLVQLHQQQHRSGLAKKVWSLESPEDIQRWREERKRNFPTAENVAKKKASYAEKVARGEVIEEKYFGKMRNRGRGRGNFRGRGRGQGRDGRSQPHYDNDHRDLKRKASEDGEAAEDEESSPKKQIKKESDATANVLKDDPLSLFFCNVDSDESSEEESEPDKPPSRTPPVTAAGALGSLMSSYVDTDSGEDGEEMEEDKKATDAKQGMNSKTKKEKEELNTQGHHHGNTKKQRNKSRKGNKRCNRENPPPLINKTLLEKLLAKEIRQERNKILQCVHYIVKNNFFDKPTS